MRNNRSDYSNNHNHNNSSIGNCNFYPNNNNNNSSRSFSNQTSFNNNNNKHQYYQQRDNYHHQQQHHHHQQQQHHYFNQSHPQRENDRVLQAHNLASNYNVHNNLNNNNNDINKNDQETRQDVIFRKVRGILNKITPETFDKLCKDLTNVGLDSPKTLRGVIYLIFDKALKDLKYSSLYAKLCQELSEKVPNFEANKSGPNTFCKFLISKCEDEFARRRKATEDFDNKLELTDEEYELRAIAKQKMLGNIKFICELGKKRLLQEEILHECIRELLSKKKERSIQDQAQDLECLCQIMRTIGSLLDVQASRNLMNQYFERINLYSEKKDLPSRIRFMLRDIIDLRKNNWKLRPFQREDNAPQTLSKLREDARGFEPNPSAVTTGLPGSLVDKFGNSKNLVGLGDLSKLSKGKLSMLIDDEPSFTTTTDFHWGPPSFLPFDDPFSDFAPTPATMKPMTGGKDDHDSNRSKGLPPPMGSLHKPAPLSKSPIETQDNVPRVLNPTPGLYRPPQPHSTKPPNSNRDFPNRNHNNNNNINRFPQQRNNANNSPPPVETHRVIRPRPQSPERLMNDIHRVKVVEPNQPDFRNFERNPRFFDGNRGSDANFQSNRAFNNSPPHQMNSRRAFNDSINQQQNMPQQKPSRFSPTHQNPDSSQGPVTQPPVFNGPRPFMNRNQPFHQSQDGHFHSDRRVGQGRFSNSFRPRGQHRDNNDGGGGFRRPSPIPTESTQVVTSSTNITNRNNVNTSNFDSFRRQPTMNTSQNPIKPRAVEPDRPPLRFQPRTHNNSNSDNPDNIPQSHGHNRDLTRPSRPTPGYLNPPRYIGNNNNPNIPGQSKPETRYRENVPPKFFDSKNPSFDTSPNPRTFQQSPPRFPTNLRKAPTQQQTNPTDRNIAIGPKEITIDPKPIFLTKSTDRLKDVNFSLRPSYKMPGRQIENNNPTSTGMSGDTTRIRTESLDDPNGKTKPQIHIESSSGTSKVNPNQTNIESNLERKPINQHDASATDPATNIYKDKFDSILEPNFKNSTPWNYTQLVSKIKELKIPKVHQQDCLVSAIKESILRSDQERKNLSKLFSLLIPSVIDHSSLIAAFKTTFDQLTALEIETPRVKSLIAGLLSQAVLNSVITFEDVGILLKGGKHHPLFLLFLQRLDESAGQAWLNDKYLASKINLMQMLPEVDQTRNRLASVLKDRSLGYLDPMLTTEPDLWQHMKEKDASPAGVYRWIKENVHSTIQESPAFAHVLISCLLKYIHEAASNATGSASSPNNNKTDDESGNNGRDTQSSKDGSDSSKSTPTASSASLTISNDLEREYLIRYQQILQALIKDKQMQLATLYSLQSFYFKLDFPKGSLLRWFDMLYDLNIIDEDVFFTWKEEINDEFPGKGQALFQVNTWLNWLAEAESEDEED